jgi:methylmalonyl-CoA/ethylmalonyl-CoA epimerase
VTQTTGAPSTLSLSRIGQIAVRVHDLDRALAFYRDTLGIPFLFRAGNLAFFDCAGVRLMLGVAEDREFDHPSSTIYFTVDDIKLAHTTFLQRGVTFRSEPHLIARLADREVWMAFFFDSEDNTLALMSEIPHA